MALSLSDFRILKIPQPGHDEVEVRHTCILSSTLDVELGEEWSEDSATLPFTPGFSAAGVITELGSGVLSHQIGQRVAYCTFPMNANHAHASHFYGSLVAPFGAYCETRIVPINCLVSLPDFVNNTVAAAILFPGLLTRMLVKTVVSLEKDQKVLVHPATGLLGSLVCQWATHLGAFVIGTISSDDLRVKTSGCRHHVVCNDYLDFARKVKEISEGDGVSVVYDLTEEGIQKDFVESLDPKSFYVTLAKGLSKETTTSLQKVSRKGSLIKVDFGNYAKSNEDLIDCAKEVFELLRTGQLQCSTTRQCPLELAAQGYGHMTSQRSAVEFCLLIPPVPDPQSVPDGS